MFVFVRASTRHGLPSSRALFLRGHGFFRVFLLVVLFELVVIHERLLADGARRLEAVRAGAAELGLALLGSSGFFRRGLVLGKLFLHTPRHRGVRGGVPGSKGKIHRGSAAAARQPLSLPK